MSNKNRLAYEKHWTEKPLFWVLAVLFFFFLFHAVVPKNCETGEFAFTIQEERDARIACAKD